MPLVNQLAPFGRVVVRQQQPERHRDELGIAVIPFAIGEGQLGALQVDVQVIGRVVAQGGEVITLEQLQVLQQHRPLTPRAALQHFDAAIGRMNGLIDLGAVAAEFGEVLEGEQA